MNCHAVQQLLSAERDQTLGADAHGSIEAHLAECPACRKMRLTLAETAIAWRTTTARMRVPDERLEWQRLRRRLNGDTAREARPARGIFTLGRSATFAAAAAVIALGLFVAPAWLHQTPVPNASPVATTDFVEVGGDASSAMVFVDDKSGWLVVWAADAADATKVGG
jgi:predicted anti-sigma-YlaC factor YlaD